MPAVVDAEKCDACGSCVDVCPSSAIKIEEKAIVTPEDCIDCAACVSECTHGAIAMAD